VYWLQVVLRRHGMEPIDAATRTAMTEALTRVANGSLGANKWFIDEHQRTIAAHRHWHARPKTSPLHSVSQGMKALRQARNRTSATNKGAKLRARL